MKHILPILALLVVANMATAQDVPRQKEIGITFANLDNFGLTYRLGHSKAMWRFSSLLISGADRKYVRDSTTSNNNNFGFNVGAGREWRKESAKSLELRIGSALYYGYAKSKSAGPTQSFESTEHRYGVNLILGLNYLIKEHLVLGVELLPALNYFTDKSLSSSSNGGFSNETIEESSGIEYGISNTSARLSILYRF